MRFWNERYEVMKLKLTCHFFPFTETPLKLEPLLLPVCARGMFSITTLSKSVILDSEVMTSLLLLSISSRGILALLDSFLFLFCEHDFRSSFGDVKQLAFYNVKLGLL